MTEHPTAMTEVMNLVVVSILLLFLAGFVAFVMYGLDEFGFNFQETSVALRKSLPAIIKSVFPRNNVAMATMTVVTTAMKGIVVSIFFIFHRKTKQIAFQRDTTHTSLCTGLQSIIQPCTGHPSMQLCIG